MKNNNVLQRSLRITGALIGILAIPYSMGAVIYENGFETGENYTTTGGSGGVGRIAGQGNDGGSLNNWTASNGENSTIVTSSSGATTLTPPRGSQMLQIQYYGTSAASLQQVFASEANSIKENFSLSFKLAINEATAGNAAMAVFLNSTGYGASGLYFGVLAEKISEGVYDYRFAIRQSPPGEGSSYTFVGNDTMDINEWHTFNLDLDYDTLTLSGQVLDSGNNEVTSFSGIDIWDRDGNLGDWGFNRIGVSVHQKGNEPYILVDDIQMTMIPEPSSLVLGFLGLTILSVRRRKA